MPFRLLSRHCSYILVYAVRKETLMWMRTDDPVADFNAREARLERALSLLPVCCECDLPFQTEECYEVNGEMICLDCMTDHHLKRTENFVR